MTKGAAEITEIGYRITLPIDIAERVERFCERRELDVSGWLSEQVEDRIDFQLGLGDYAGRGEPRDDMIGS